MSGCSALRDGKSIGFAGRGVLLGTSGPRHPWGSRNGGLLLDLRLALVGGTGSRGRRSRPDLWREGPRAPRRAASPRDGSWRGLVRGGLGHMSLASLPCRFSVSAILPFFPRPDRGPTPEKGPRETSPLDGALCSARGRVASGYSLTFLRRTTETPPAAAKAATVILSDRGQEGAGVGGVAEVSVAAGGAGGAAGGGATLVAGRDGGLVNDDGEDWRGRSTVTVTGCRQRRRSRGWPPGSRRCGRRRRWPGRQRIGSRR